MTNIFAAVVFLVAGTVGAFIQFSTLSVICSTS